jgi:hypothetical protein
MAMKTRDAAIAAWNRRASPLTASPPAPPAPLTLDGAVAVLNRERHRGRDDWTADPAVDLAWAGHLYDTTQRLLIIEAMAMASDYERSLARPAASPPVGVDDAAIARAAAMIVRAICPSIGRGFNPAIEQDAIDKVARILADELGRPGPGAAAETRGSPDGP